MTSTSAGRYLLDADAFIWARLLSIITRAKESGSIPRPIFVTQYVARHELSSLDRELRVLEELGVILVKEVLAKQADFRRLRQEGADKGESESIAWALTVPPPSRPIFISGDRKARWFARKNGVIAGDLMDLLVDLVEERSLTMDEARAHAAPWEDRRQQRGRPSDFTRFDESFDRRRMKRWNA